MTPQKPSQHPLWNKTTAIVALVAIAFIAAYSIFGDIAKLGDAMSHFHWPALGVALGLSLVNYFIRYIRWCWYLKRLGNHVPHGINAEIFLSGFAFSITPGKVGELIKSVLLSKYKGIPISKTAPIVVAERVSDLCALLVLGLIGIWLYGVATTMVFAGAAVISFGMIVLAIPALATRIVHVITTPKALASLRQRLLDFYNTLRSMMGPRDLAISTTLGIVAWLAECLGFALIVNSFAGATVPFGLAILIYAATTIAGALSFLPGGLVVTETTMTLWLIESSRGIDEASAIAATILTRLATLWFAVVIGLIAFTTIRRHSAAKPGETS